MNIFTPITDVGDRVNVFFESMFFLVCTLGVGHKPNQIFFRGSNRTRVKITPPVKLCNMVNYKHIPDVCTENTRPYVTRIGSACYHNLMARYIQLHTHTLILIFLGEKSNFSFGFDLYTHTTST